MGADIFVLSDRFEVYYRGETSVNITDFNAQQDDKLQVHGSQDDYSFGSGDLAGGDANDTLVKYQGNTIAVVVDIIGIEFDRDFIFL